MEGKTRDIENDLYVILGWASGAAGAQQAFDSLTCIFAAVD